MPASYTIDKERRLVTSTMTGVLTQAEVLEQVHQLVTDPTVDPAFSQLVDCRQVTELKCSAEEVRQIATTDIFSAQSRRAFLVTDDLLYGLARMYEIHRELRGEGGIRVFRNVDEAMEWVTAENARA